MGGNRVPDAKAKPTKSAEVRGGVPHGKSRRALSTGSPDQLLRHVWYALRRAGDLLDDPDSTPELILRAVHAISGASNAYTKVHEAHALQVEVRELRETVEQLVANQGGAAYSRQNAARPMRGNA